jgi:subtilisin family serine protease
MKMKYVPNDPMFPQEWHLPQIDAPQLWDYVTGDDDLVIGIVDAGIFFTHPDLKDNIWINQAELPGFDINQILETGNIVGGDGIDNDNNGYVDDVIGWNFKNNNNDAYQDYPSNDHGTHVAGCAAAVGDNSIGVTGVAMHLKLISSKHAPTN